MKSRPRLPVSLLFLAAPALAVLGMLVTIPGASSGSPIPCYTHAEFESPTQVGESPQDAVRILGTRVLTGNDRRDALEKERFELISAAALTATVSVGEADSAVLEAKAGSELLGRFEVSRGADGWVVRSLTVSVPATFCAPRQERGSQLVRVALSVDTPSGVAATTSEVACAPLSDAAALTD